MLTRILTAVIALAVFAGVLLAPPIVFTIALTAVIFMMLYECYKATGADAAMKIAGFISAAMLLVSMYTVTSARLISVYMAAAVSVLLYMALVVFEHGKRDYKDILANGFLTFYIVGSMWCLQFTRTFFGTSLMLITFIAAWSTDTCAYFSGRFFGKRKLIPNVSPNKTIAGSVGGVIGSIIVCSLALCAASLINGEEIVRVINHIPNYLLLGAVYGGAGGVFSQLGDLAASAIKRDTGIKDFGWIFPGHGGFMDRFDSVMYIAPIILILLSLFGI